MSFPESHPMYIPPLPPGYVETKYTWESVHWHTLETRARLGFPKWGLVIYRGTYKDDALWEKCITLLKIDAENELRMTPGDEGDRLRPDLEWTIIEDRDKLDGASPDVVRAHFLDWVAARSVERDGPGADGRWVQKWSPRYRFCAYIDQASLDSMVALWGGLGPDKSWRIEGRLIVIDGGHGHHDEDMARHYPEFQRTKDEQKEQEEREKREREEAGLPPIEVEWWLEDPGWSYEDVGGLLEAYDALHGGGNRLEWEVWEIYRGRARNCEWMESSSASPWGPSWVSLAEVDLSRKE